MPTAVWRKLVASTAWCLLTVACGQKGPPLPPLHLVPAAVTEVTARRVEDRVRLRFVLPTRNANGPGPVDLDRVEIYAMTVGPGSPPPANRFLLAKQYLVGQIAVRPPPVEGEAQNTEAAQPEPAKPDPTKPEPAKAEDTRPEPGAVVTFDEELTPEKLTPAVTKTEPAPVVPPVPATATAAIPPVPPLPTNPVRVYALRGVTKSGRPGPPAQRVQLLLVPLPIPPEEVTARFTETATVIEWKPPAAGTPVSFNVYTGDEPLQPVNRTPAAGPPFEFTAAKRGEEQCFRVRSVTKAGEATVEGAPSKDACITARDVFAPAAPKGLQAVATPGQINLIWDANGENDLAGYVVLRGEVPDGALQPLTPAPVRETSYRDEAVKPGVRYVYAIVAVDNAVPPNTSAHSERKEETAR